MSNPVKTLKKNFKNIVKVAVIAAAAYTGLGMVGLAGAAPGAGSLSAAASSTSAIQGGTNLGTGLLAGMGRGAATVGSEVAKAGPLAKIGSMFKGMSPLAQASTIQAGAGFLAGGLAEEPRDEAEQKIAYNEYLQSQNADPGRVVPQGMIRQAPQTPSNAFYQQRQAQPFQQYAGSSAPVMRLNPQTGQWEQS